MSQFPQLNEVNEKNPLVIVHTNQGDFTLELFPEVAPKTVENFVTHAKNGYYDGVIFHRVIEDFMIQGGDPTGTGMGGESIYGRTFEDEFSREAFNLYGTLSMANAGPNTNGSQFFIVTAKQVPAQMLKQLKDGGWPEEIVEEYAKVGGTPWLDHRHTVFGRVVEGMDVVLKIEGVERNAQDRPLEDVVIESMDVKA
ncbi:peptidylprolyl isomerase [Granulicatella sp. 20925_1_28]|uniref:peptidylprolyl isomerase n=1 Tax=Granulicatella sp. 20925_1_28 TaxID=3003686 RepID=UPI00352E2993